MNTAIINVKTDPETKREIQEFAHSVGLTVSGLLNAQLRQILRTRKVELTDTLEPTPYLEKIMRDTEKDLKSGKNITKTYSSKEAIAHLESLMK